MDRDGDENPVPQLVAAALDGDHASWNALVDRYTPLVLSVVRRHRLIERYRQRHGLSLSHPRVALLDLQYHDVSRERGLFYRLQSRGEVDRTCTEDAIEAAIDRPPQTTRARLRGEFIKKAKDRRRDFTVDWVHLKLNDQAQRTVLLKDPFRARDERVEKLIDGL